MKQLAELLIRFYRRVLSPLKPPVCKYYPTCSQYALTSYHKHGFFKGTILAVWRLLRCNPWSMGGVDHVPDKFTDALKIKRAKK
ncbi:MAG: membrane protein insertion efficiency factor YidD [Oscillospiraceae bacterium]